MKGILKGKILKKLKTIKAISYLKPEKIVYARNCHTPLAIQGQEPEIIDVSELMKDLDDQEMKSIDCIYNNENVNPGKGLESSFFLKEALEAKKLEKGGFRGDPLVEIAVSNFLPPDLDSNTLMNKENVKSEKGSKSSGFSKKNVEVLEANKLEKRGYRDEPLVEIAVSNFRPPDLDSSTLFDPNLLALFGQAVMEESKKSGILKDNAEELEDEVLEAEELEKSDCIYDKENVKPDKDMKRSGYLKENVEVLEANELEKGGFRGDPLVEIAVSNFQPQDLNSSTLLDTSLLPVFEQAVIEESNESGILKENVEGIKDEVFEAKELEKSDSEADPSSEVLNFRRPDWDSGTLFDPNLLALFQQTVMEVKAQESERRAKIAEKINRGIEDEPPFKARKIEIFTNPLLDFVEKCPPGGENAVILYTTGLRGIRKTFEDCHKIRFLLENFRVLFFERDVSMHSGYKEELWKVMEGKVVPPRLFIRGRYIGGAEEVVTLHEQGKLRPLFEGIPIDDSRGYCESCSGVRFVMCFNCNGSRKVFSEEDGESVKCLSCNENGLIVCSLCC